MITDKAMLVSVHVSVWTARKHDKRVTERVAQEYGADTRAGRYNKKLLANAEKLEEINNLVGRIRKWVCSVTLPWSDDGPRILPAEIYFEFGKQWTGFESEFERAVDGFLAVYHQYVEEVRPILGAMFREDEYPSVARLREKFSIKRDILPIPTGADFRVSLNEAEQERIAREIDEANKRTMAAGIRELWQRLYKVVRHMADQFGDPDRKLYATTIENLKDLVDLLPMLNLAADPDLTALTERARVELCQYTTEDLRRSPATRKAVAAQAAGIAQRIAITINIPEGEATPGEHPESATSNGGEDEATAIALDEPAPAAPPFNDVQQQVEAITSHMLPFMNLTPVATA